jgi:hypothetical protein
MALCGVCPVSPGSVIGITERQLSAISYQLSAEAREGRDGLLTAESWPVRADLLRKSVGLRDRAHCDGVVDVDSACVQRLAV